MAAYDAPTQITPIFNAEYYPSIFGANGLTISEADDRYLKLTGGIETGIVEFQQGLETNQILPTSTGNALNFTTTGRTNFTGDVNVPTNKNFLVNGIPLIAPQTSNTGKFLTTNGSTTSWGTPPQTSVGGSNTQIQYNNNGAFAGSANLAFTNSNTLSIANQFNVLDTSAGANSLTLQQVSNQSFLNWGATNNLNFTTGTSPALTRGFWSGATGQLTLYNGISVGGTTQFNSSFSSNGISNSGLITTDNIVNNQKITIGSQQSPNQPLWYRGGTITMFRGQTSGNPFNVPLPVLNATGFVCGSIYNNSGNWMSFTGSSRGSSGINLQMNGSDPSVVSYTFTLNGVQQTGLQFGNTALNSTCYYCIYVLSDGFNG